MNKTMKEHDDWDNPGIDVEEHLNNARMALAFAVLCAVAMIGGAIMGNLITVLGGLIASTYFAFSAIKDANRAMDEVLRQIVEIAEKYSEEEENDNVQG